MMSTIFAFVFIFVIFGAIYFSGVYAARESVRAIEERDLEGGEWAIALIPFLNCHLVDRSLNGFGKGSLIAIIAGFVGMIISGIIALFPVNAYLLIFAIVVRYLSVFTLYFTLSVVYIKYIAAFGTRRMFIIITLLFPFFGAFLIGNNARLWMAEVKEAEKEAQLKGQYGVTK